MPKGSVLTVSFTLSGQEFLALNGGPIFKFAALKRAYAGR
jgi:predicted 3-demethylubiquinone-9 3-methyltransferase (glyoxalase superfamily)